MLSDGVAAEPFVLDSIPFALLAGSEPDERDRLACGVFACSTTASGVGASGCLSLSLIAFLDFLDVDWAPCGGVPGGCGDDGLPLLSRLVNTERSVGASVATDVGDD